MYVGMTSQWQTSVNKARSPQTRKWTRTFIWTHVTSWTLEYGQTSSMKRTKSQYLNVSRLVLQLSLLNPLKSGVRSRMKMLLEQHRQAMLPLTTSWWSTRLFYTKLRLTLEVWQRYHTVIAHILMLSEACSLKLQGEISNLYRQNPHGNR